MPDLPGTRVALAMVTAPVTHDWRRATVGELRSLFLDEHVHMALLVEEDRLVAAVERSDLAKLPDGAPARGAGTLRGRTVRPEADLAEVFESMRRAGRRRLAVTDERGVLQGLLCLKASGAGFCSDEDVASRRPAAPSARP